MTSLSVQLFTSKSISHQLVSRLDALSTLYKACLRILSPFCELGRLLPVDDPIGCTLLNLHYHTCLNDALYLLRCELGDITNALPAYLDVMLLTQGVDPIVHQKGEHVEVEDVSIDFYMSLMRSTDMPLIINGCSLTVPSFVSLLLSLNYHVHAITRISSN